MPGVPSTLTKIGSREHVVMEARSWQGTPYHLGGRVKRAGVDCGTYLMEVLIACSLVTRAEFEDLGFYGHDWFCHETSDPRRYLRMMMRHAELVMEGVAYVSTRTEPGNLVLSKVVDSKHYNHGGIVTEWPRVMHCVAETGVGEVDATTDPLWCPQKVAIFDPWRKPS